MTDTLTDYLSLSDAEATYGLKADSLKKRCQQGLIVGAKKIGKTWFVPKLPGVDPQRGESEKPKRDFFIDICIRGANEIRSSLHIDDTAYLRVFFSAHTDVRKYYIYGVLDEIEKAGIALMGYEEVLKDTSGHSGDRISRNTVGSVVDQQMVWVRKLTEILVDLILFGQINDQHYYRHYLLGKHLEGLQNAIADAKEFFVCENENHKYQKTEISAKISQLESQIDLSKCWYLKNDRKNGGKHSATKREFSSSRDKHKLALLQADADQKLALGISYGNSFSRSSQSLHPNFIDPNTQAEIKDIEVGIAQIGILSAHILILCKKLIGDGGKKGLVAQLARIFRNNKYPDQLLKARSNPSIKEGDFVIAYGDIAEVIKINKSAYGYRSFKVKYLATPPLPHILVDTFPAMFVKKFYERKKISDEVKQLIRKTTPTEKINNKQVSDSLRKTMADMWEKFGFKERYYGRPDLANEKIRKHLEEEKNKSNAVPVAKTVD